MVSVSTSDERKIARKRMDRRRGKVRSLDGPCMNFRDKSGNDYAILQMTRPHVLEKEFQKVPQEP